MKKNIILSVSIVFTAIAGLFALDAVSINAIYNGDVIKNIKLYNFSGDEYFSVRELAKLYCAELVWHPISGKASLNLNNKRLDIFIKSTRIMIDGRKKRLEMPSRSFGNDAFVPKSFVLSRDFNDFAKTITSFNPETKVLTIENRINLLPVRFYSKAGKTQLIIEMLEDIKYNWDQKTPGLIRITFPRGQIGEDAVCVDDGIVKEIHPKNSGKNAVIDIYITAGAGKIEDKVLSNPSRLVIDIERTMLAEKKFSEVVNSTQVFQVQQSSEAVDTSVVAETAAPVAVAADVPEVLPEPAAQIKNTKKVVVVLDAGHGGDDPGAVGRNGSKEKDINLAIVRELKKLFDDAGDYETILSREDDTFIPLVDRTNLANEKKADLFVSVHCNASMNKDSKGFEIYFLNEQASDPEAQATAALENSVVNLEKKASKKKEKLQELMWSMVVNEFINESSELCSLITKEVTKRIRVDNRGVKQAGFFVLRGTQMPAVLVECAFISHLGEEAKLNTKGYQGTMADAIFEGVRNYEFRKITKDTNNKNGKKKL